VVIAKKPPCHGLLGCIGHGLSSAVHSVGHVVADHWQGIAQVAVLTGTLALTVLSDGATAPLLADEAEAFAGADAVAAATEVADTAEETASGADEVASAGGEESNAPSCAMNSFVAGTPVLLANGKTIPIQKVRVGTKVKSVDQFHVLFRPLASRVVALIRHPDADLYRLKVDHTAIEATGNHRFFVKGKGWVAVRDLRSGMMLEEYGGTLTHLTSIIREHRPASTVYNFEVGRTHTYFAGRAEVLVHNCGSENPLEGTKYTPKVQAQMSNPGDLYHSFPSSVDALAQPSDVSIEPGEDGVARINVRIPGSINGTEGEFRYILEPDEVSINHRLFEPW